VGAHISLVFSELLADASAFASEAFIVFVVFGPSYHRNAMLPHANCCLRSLMKCMSVLLTQTFSWWHCGTCSKGVCVCVCVCVYACFLVCEQGASVLARA
jgi:hypothetical protein